MTQRSLAPPGLVHLRAVAEWTWLPPLQVQALAPAMNEWKPTLWCSASAPPEFHQFSGSNHGIRNISSWTFRSMISLDVWWPQPLWTPLWPRDEKQHQPIQLTHNPPKPSTTKEHGRTWASHSSSEFASKGSNESDETHWVFTKFLLPNLQILNVSKPCLLLSSISTAWSASGSSRLPTQSRRFIWAAETVWPITILVDGETWLFGIDIKIVNWGIARDWFINHSWWAYQLLSIPASTLRPLAYCSE